MNTWKKVVAIFFILLLGAVLRIWHLGQTPPSLTWDEAALGYNAYSILKTAKDEYGNFLPLNLKSFGDYKPAVYTYLDIPFVAILGLNEYSVRLPSALFGVLLVFLVFKLVQELFSEEKMAYLAAFMTAISALGIEFSRIAFESNVAVSLNVLGLLLFLKGLKVRFYWIFSALLFGLSVFTYQSSRLFVPLIVICLIFIYRKKIKLDRFSFISGGVLGLFALVLIYTVFSAGGSNRLAVTNLFAYTRSPQEIQTISKEDGLAISSWQFQILHGEWFAYARGLSQRYLLYFSPKMLFIDGGTDPREKVPDLGVLYYFSVAFIPLGLVYLLQRKFKESKLLFAWLLLAPLPAVLARDLISILRSLNLILPFVILEGAGLYFLLEKLSSLPKKIYLVSLSIIFGLILLNFAIFLDRYFIHLPQELSEGFVYGYKQVFELAGSPAILAKYNNVVISDTYGQPYIYYLFYNQYLPAKFQSQAVLDQPTVDVGTVRHIDNISFRHVYWPEDRGLKNSLFIASPQELPLSDIIPYKQFKILAEVKFLDGQTAFRIVQTQ